MLTMAARITRTMRDVEAKTLPIYHPMSPGYHPYQTLQLAEAWEHSPHLRAAPLPGPGGAARLSKPYPYP